MTLLFIREFLAEEWKNLKFISFLAFQISLILVVEAILLTQIFSSGLTTGFNWVMLAGVLIFFIMLVLYSRQLVLVYGMVGKIQRMEYSDGDVTTLEAAEDAAKTILSKDGGQT